MVRSINMIQQDDTTRRHTLRSTEEIQTKEQRNETTYPRSSKHAVVIIVGNSRTCLIRLSNIFQKDTPNSSSRERRRAVSVRIMFAREEGHSLLNKKRDCKVSLTFSTCENDPPFLYSTNWFVPMSRVLPLPRQWQGREQQREGA